MYCIRGKWQVDPENKEAEARKRSVWAKDSPKPCVRSKAAGQRDTHGRELSWPAAHTCCGHASRQPAFLSETSQVNPGSPGIQEDIAALERWLNHVPSLTFVTTSTLYDGTSLH